MNRTFFLLFALFLGAAALANDQPTVGATAPGFKLQDQNGAWRSLEDYRGQWLAIYFYPKDDTPGCTTEACEFRDNIFAFRDLNAQILGVSLDDVESHKSFAESYDLPFPLLADVEGAASTAYGVKTRMMGMEVAKRQTFIISPDGTVAKHYAKVNPSEHTKEVLADLVELGAP